MKTADSIVTAINILPNHRMFFSIFCNIWNSSVFFAPDHSPDSRMILILLTIPILLNRSHKRIVEAMLLLANRHRVSPVFHEVFPHSQRIARFRREDFPRERNQVGVLVSFSKKLHRVSLVARTSQDQFSATSQVPTGHLANYQVALIYQEVFLRSLRIARFRREEFPRDQVELFLPVSKKFYQVAPIVRAS